MKTMNDSVAELITMKHENIVSTLFQEEANSVSICLNMKENATHVW